MVKKFVTKNLDVRKMFLSVGGGLKRHHISSQRCSVCDCRQVKLDEEK
jgi:hypothetical protein